MSLAYVWLYVIHSPFTFILNMKTKLWSLSLPLFYLCLLRVKSFLTFMEIHIHPKTIRKLSPFSKTRVSAFSIHEAGLIPPSNTKGRTSLDEKEPPASPGPTTGESQSKLRVGILFGGHLNNGRHRPKPKFVITKSKYFSKNSIKDFDRK